jgi:exonuclease III
MNKHYSFISLNVNDLNSSLKSVTNWIQKQDLYICCTQEIPEHQEETSSQDKGMEKVVPSNKPKKQASEAILYMTK